MNKPPNGQYRKPFDNEVNYTADHKVITSGLRVFTNNLDRGVIDLSQAQYEWHGPENRYHLWFDVLVDTTYKGEPTNQRVMQSDDRVATRYQGRQA